MQGMFKLIMNKDSHYLTPHKEFDGNQKDTAYPG